MYPRIIINSKKIKENIQQLKEMCQKNHIPFLTLVVKALAGNIQAIKEISTEDFLYLGDSRIQNLKKMKDLPQKKMLLRIPNNQELSQVIRYSDCSLESEMKTIFKLNEIAKKQNIVHQILLMFDLGDLREGIFFDSNYKQDIQKIVQLTNIDLIGIGTNLTCYGGVLPSKDNLNMLVDIANSIEKSLDIKLNLISGGNSSTIALFNQSVIPQRINHLRIGEGYLFGRETAYGKQIDNMHSNAFVLETKIIECKQKPSYPIGDIGMNSFGEIPNIVDRGIMRRAIVGIGKQDVILENLIPEDERITIIGGSSDHLILDVSKTNFQLNDVIRFNVNYPGLVHLMNSAYVQKIIK
ncbi:MAG: alanine/ornithine racemase family PLP-dependent enzyme [Firmicutes bacterium]|nr:alanine/ornithine racemase family PLP-dependent enzyme [Bacillota bacterium]